MSYTVLSSLLAGWVGLGLLLLVLAFVVVRQDKGHGAPPWLSDAVVTALGMWLPPLTLGVSLSYIVLALTRFDAADAFRGLLWMHRIAVGGLGSFLLLGQYLQLEGLVKDHRGHGAPSLARTYRRFRLITELMPAPSALMILLSGLALMYRGQYALSSHDWLFYLVTFWAFFFGDGLLGYLPQTRTFLRLALAAIPNPQRMQELRAVMRQRVSTLLMLVHFLSFPCVVYLGYFKPHVPHPLGSLLLALEHACSPLLAAVGWIGVIVGAVFLARRLVTAAALGWATKTEGHPY